MEVINARDELFSVNQEVRALVDEEERGNTIWLWIAYIVFAIIAITITFLLASYLLKRRKPVANVEVCTCA
ncbi:putative transmembrane protein [Cedratvirus kamchatka]|uniref:Transmembrane protein n=1 Tax=Cedratvirus kamchatka TaxID=2716914 RepID=A0A6G8MZ69_9VIRU|nr:putative transmembrane protein [Cedratvirus kamchatka]WIL04435.1 putative membrane protein [Cedratvirus lena]WIL05026.1 putative membrane protein [Cedratvirus duvanny]